MAIRLPLTNVLGVQNNGLIGAASVAGGISNTFLIPQDTDNVVVKMTASIAGGGVSTVLQTSDDGGATWYDVARTSVVSNANNALAEWLSVPVIGGGVATGATFAVGSVLSMGIGNAAASTLGQREVSGLPILGRQARTFLIVGSGVTGVASVTTTVMVNSQSPSGQ